MPLRRYEIVDILEVFDKIGWELKDLAVKECYLSLSPKMTELLIKSLKKHSSEKEVNMPITYRPNSFVKLTLQENSFSDPLIELTILRMLGVTIDLQKQIIQHFNIKL